MKWSDPATIARISFLNMVCNMGRIGHIAIYLMISIWHGGFAGVLSRHSHAARRISAANAFARRVQDTANTPPHRMQGARVVAVVGEFEAAGMAELVAMDVNGILASSRAA